MNLMAFVFLDRDVAAVSHQDEDVAVKGLLPASEGGEKGRQPAIDLQEMLPVAWAFPVNFLVQIGQIGDQKIGVGFPVKPAPGDAPDIGIPDGVCDQESFAA